MRNLFVLVMLCILTTTVYTSAKDEKKESTESKIKIGVLKLECYGKADEVVNEAESTLVSELNELGFYECYDFAALEKILNSQKQKLPSHCMDPKCVLEIGDLTGMDRILYGSIDFSNKRCGVSLTILRVRDKQQLASVNIAGEAGVKSSEVIKVALERLHGNKEQGKVKIEQYYGPEIHNERKFLISSATVIGAGLLYAAINYITFPELDIIPSYYTKESLSGIQSTNIPLFARPAALANAYTAASDDAYGVFYNPAGMSWIGGEEGVLAYQYRFGLDNIAASYVNKATREIGYGHGILYRADRENLMTELYFVSCVSYKVNSLPYYIHPFSLGASLKIISNRVKSTSDISPGGGSVGVGLDLGFMWELSEKIRYGLLFRDLPTINYWKNMRTDKRYFELNPTTLQMGGIFLASYSTYLVADGEIPLYKEQPWKMAGGIEQELFKFVRLRIGLQREIMAPYYETPWKITGGFGVDIGPQYLKGRYLSLDGSYEYNTLEIFDIINVSMRFGF